VLGGRRHAAHFDVSIWAPAWVDAIESVANTEDRTQNTERRTQKIEC